MNDECVAMHFQCPLVHIQKKLYFCLISLLRNNTSKSVYINLRHSVCVCMYVYIYIYIYINFVTIYMSLEFERGKFYPGPGLEPRPLAFRANALPTEPSRTSTSPRKAFLWRIITIYETWARAYEPQLKRQSNDWHHHGSPRKVIVRQAATNVIAMLIIAYNWDGVIIKHTVPQRHTVTVKYYCTLVQDNQQAALRRK